MRFEVTLIQIFRINAVFLLFLIGASTFGQGHQHATTLYLDGRNITPGSRIELKRDALLRFEAYNIQSGTPVKIEAKKGGIKFWEATYQPNPRGEIKTILIFPQPKTKMPIACFVQYTAADGNEKKVRFVLKPV